MFQFFPLDSENDEILVACEEDFRLFLEQGKGRKIFFNANGKIYDDENDEPVVVAMDAEDIAQKCDRRARKG